MRKEEYSDYITDEMALKICLTRGFNNVDASDIFRSNELNGSCDVIIQQYHSICHIFKTRDGKYYSEIGHMDRNGDLPRGNGSTKYTCDKYPNNAWFTNAWGFEYAIFDQNHHTIDCVYATFDGRPQEYHG